MAPKSTSGFAYTKNEEEWFRIAAADFVKWQAKRKADEEDADTRFFVSRTLSAWYESFPERHPRTYRQHSESAEEAARMLLGPEMLRMHERIRHKLNYNKRFLTAEDLLGPVSGIVDTSEGVLVNRPTQGYRHLLATSPYGPDSLNTRMADVAGHRLALWKSEDYSAATDEERSQMLRDLPLDMEEIVATLSRHTGAEFYMLAAWHNSGNQARFYDVLSARSRSFASRCRNALQNTRDAFLTHTMMHLGTRMSVEMQSAGATVYGVPDGSYRPWLPRWFENWQGLNEICYQFIAYTADWQALPLPSPWEEHEHPEDPFVSPDRLPEGWKGLPHPDTWNRELTEQFARHVWAGQQNELPASRRFQLRDTRDDADDSAFRETQHPSSTLKYGPEARLFLRRLMIATGNDPHADAEVRSHLPGLPDQENIQPLFDNETFEALQELVQGSAEMTELLLLITEYELEGPIQAASGHWNRMYDTSTHFPLDLPDVDAGLEVLSGPWLPTQYFGDALRREASSASMTMEVFAYWLRSGLLVHPLTRTVLAGPWGVKWPALVLICAYWTGQQLELGEQPPEVTEEVQMSQSERDIVIRETIWLTGHIRQSIDALQTMYEAASQSVIPPVLEINNAHYAKRHVPPYLQSDEEDSDDASQEGFVTFYRRLVEQDNGARAVGGVPRPTKRKQKSKAGLKSAMKGKSALKRKVKAATSTEGPPKVHFDFATVPPTREESVSMARPRQPTPADQPAPFNVSMDEEDWHEDDADGNDYGFRIDEIAASIEASRVTAAARPPVVDHTRGLQTPGASGSGNRAGSGSSDDVSEPSFSPTDNRRKRQRKTKHRDHA